MWNVFYSKIYFICGELAGAICIGDPPREEAADAIRRLRESGIKNVVMLTGDNERTARAIGAQAGVDEVIAGVLPDGKESVIRTLQDYGKVMMVGGDAGEVPCDGLLRVRQLLLHLPGPSGADARVQTLHSAL